MKIVTLTYVSRFEDDVSDEDAIASSVECLSQDGNFPNDDQVSITHKEGSPDDD